MIESKRIEYDREQLVLGGVRQAGNRFYEVKCGTAIFAA
jgi:hypothetical protein